MYINLTVLLFGFTLMFTSARAESDNNTFYNQVWSEIVTSVKPVLYNFVVTCASFNIESPFDTTKVINDLESCVKADLKEVLTLIQMKDHETQELSLILHEIMRRSEREERKTLIQPSQINLLRKRLVEPICEFIPKFLSCMDGRQEEVINSCSPGSLGGRKAKDYVKVLAQSLCKENGTRVLDFIQTGGLFCVPTYIHGGLECAKTISTGYQDPPKIICNDVKKFHECLTTTVNVCLVEKPVQILSSVFEEVKPWISGQDFGQCGWDSSDSNERTLPIFSLVSLAGILSLIFLVHN